LLCWTDGPADEVRAVDTVAGTVRMKSGAVVAARFSRREHLAEEAQVVREERIIQAFSHTKGTRSPRGGSRKRGRNTRSDAPRPGSGSPKVCGVCGWGHDAGFAWIVIPGRPVITLHGAMTQIVGLVHAAQASGAGPVSTKDERLLKICGGYRHPCKVFDDRKRSADYKVLFDTRRRGFLGLKGNKSVEVHGK